MTLDYAKPGNPSISFPSLHFHDASLANLSIVSSSLFQQQVSNSQTAPQEERKPLLSKDSPSTKTTTKSEIAKGFDAVIRSRGNGFNDLDDYAHPSDIR